MQLRSLVVGMALVAACKQDKSAPPPPPSPPSPPPVTEHVVAAPPVDAAPFAVDPAKLPAAMAGEQVFAGKLFDALRAQPGNLFFSPTSIRLALAMTAAGARGATATELDGALGLPSDPAQRAEAHAGFAALIGELAARGHVETSPTDPDYVRAEAESRRTTVAIANRVWPQLGKTLVPEYTRTLATGFGSSIEPLDFVKDPGAARGIINAWVSDRTAGKIPELLGPPSVTSATRLVLTNAIYFKAQWLHPFIAALTTDAPFTLAGGKQVAVPMMHDTGTLAYAETPAYQVVSLPYADGSLVMNVLLPKPGHTLAEAEAGALAAPQVALQRVALGLPRFRLSGRFELVDTLRALGVRAAFDEHAADFSGIDGTHELFISQVIHQAELIVDEKGTEAAAATAVSMAAGGAPPSGTPVPFVVDHPFIVVLRDERTATNLFVGRVADPSAK